MIEGERNGPEKLNRGGLGEEQYRNMKSDLINMLAYTSMLVAAEPGPEADDMVRILTRPFPTTERYAKEMPTESAGRQHLDTFRDANPRFVAKLDAVIHEANDLRAKMVIQKEKGILDEDLAEMSELRQRFVTLIQNTN